MTEPEALERTEPPAARRGRALPTSWPRRLIQPISGLALGLILLWLTVRGIHWQAVGASLGQADPVWIGLSLLTVLLTLGAKAARWRDLFPDAAALRRRSVARALMVGMLVNAFLPFRLGDVARFHTLGRDEGISQAKVAGTIGAEKGFDTLFLLLAAALTGALGAMPGGLGRPLAAAAGLGAVLLALAAALPPRRVAAIARRTAGSRLTVWLPEPAVERLTGLVRHAMVGLESLRSPRLAAAACTWSVIIWTLAAGTNLVLFRAFDMALGPSAALLLLIVLHAGTAVPSSPGRVGVFHALTILGLRSLPGAGSAGVDPAVALAYATALHGVVYGPQILLGTLALALRPRAREAAR